MGLKKLYYAIENKYYEFVEKTGLYKITDKIDKFMPSMLFFLLLLIIIIASLFLLIPKGETAGSSSVFFTVKDAQSGTIISGVPVQISTETGVESVVTNAEGITRDIEVPKDTFFTVDVDYAVAGYAHFSKEYFSDDLELHYTIVLDSEVVETENVTYNFSVVDELNRRIGANGIATFRCSGDGIAPSQVTVYNGVIDVEADPSCDLLATVVMEGYDTVYDTPITHGTSFVHTESITGMFDGVTHSVNVFVRDNSSNYISNIKVTAYNQGIPITNCVTNTGGNCQLTGLSTGNYELKTSDQRPVQEYTASTINMYVDSDLTQSFTVSKEVNGYIKVKVVKEGNNPIAGALVSLKSMDSEIATGYTDASGLKLFAVSDISMPYRVVADYEGYLLKSVSATPVSTITDNPNVTITLEQVTETSAQRLKIRVVGENGKGYSHAKVVLYDSDTGFLTDYSPRTTDFDGNCEFYVGTGNYYAMAIKGSSTGVSSDFYFDVRQSAAMETIIIPMDISKGFLKVNVVDKDGEVVENAKINVYDRFSSIRPIKSDLTDSSGNYTTELDGDQYVYVIASDPLGNKGETQSKFVRIAPEQTSELEVTLYDKRPAISKPELNFDGLYSGDNRMSGNLKAGREYEARFTLFIPYDRDGDEDFDEVGAVIRTGSKDSVYLENDSIFIQDIMVPNSIIKRYTQYSSSDGYDDKDDVDSETKGDAKWVKVVFDESESFERDYATAYEIVATVKVKDEAVFGEQLEVHYLGFGLNEDEEYENDPVYDGNEDEVEYMAYNLDTYSIGDEIACGDNFCYSANITDITEGLREDVSGMYSAQPQKEYILKFVLINNNEDRIYTNSRLQIKNDDEGIEFVDIDITQPTNANTNIGVNASDYEYETPIEEFYANNKLKGEIKFKPILKGERKLLLNFISDQQVLFTKTLSINVLSDKTFEVDIHPQIIPSRRNFNLEVEVKDSSSGFEVDDQEVTVTVKDRFKQDIAGPVVVGALGKVNVNNIPAQEPDNKIFVYVNAPEYETYVKELSVTDKILEVNPTKIGVSLNVNTKKEETVTFNLTNLSGSDIVVESMELKGDRDEVEIIDVARTNNMLLGYNGLEVKGIDNDDDVTNNYDNYKQVEVKFTTNPRAEMITKVQNLKANIKVTVRDKLADGLYWDILIPVTVTVGFDGMMDNSACLTLSESAWEGVVLNNYVEKQFILNNTCTISDRPVPLMGGLEAKVEFESNPMGRFTVNVDNRLVELSHGYYKTIFDSVDTEKGFPVVLRYEPVGRYSGDITGKVIFRSVNKTLSGDQVLTNEYTFNLHVLSLKDCYVLSKDLIDIYDDGKEDVFTIENKGCGKATTYRLSCDDCQGIRVNPVENIDVEETGTSNEISVSAIGAIPGMYLLNIYSKVKDERGSEKNIGKLKVRVKPKSGCIDLDRYEFDLYRTLVSENTGSQLNANNYDTANIINRCYSQDVDVTGKVKSGSRWSLALYNGVRDGVVSGFGFSMLGGLFGGDSNKSGGSWWSKLNPFGGKKEKTQQVAASDAAAAGADGFTEKTEKPKVIDQQKVDTNTSGDDVNKDVVVKVDTNTPGDDVNKDVVVKVDTNTSGDVNK